MHLQASDFNITETLGAYLFQDSQTRVYERDSIAVRDEERRRRWWQSPRGGA